MSQTRKKLFIHIGNHKTATTSIQHALRANSEVLSRHGYSFFYRNRLSGENQLPDLHSWLGCVKEGSIIPEGMRIIEAARLFKELSALEGNPIISSENLSFFFSPDAVAELASAAFELFDEVKIICYIRRQDRQIISHHQEGSRLFRRWENQLYGSQSRAVPSFTASHRLYLDYHERLSKWAAAFGGRSLIVRIFEPAKMTDGDPVSDFFHLLGIVDFEPVGPLNPSRGFLATKIGHLVNASQLRNPEAVVATLGELQDSFGKLMPSRLDAESYLSNYSLSNRRLADFLGVGGESPFDADFAMYPDSSNEDWSEDRANEALLSLLRALDNVLDMRVADDLRRAAMLVRDSEPQLASALLNYALRCRPRARRIRKLLAELSPVQTGSA